MATPPRFEIVIERDDDGFFVADVTALRGCHTQGKTYEEAVDNIREVIAMCVQEIRQESAC